MTGLMIIKMNGAVNKVTVYAKYGTQTFSRWDLSVRERDEVNRKLADYWCERAGFQKMYND